MATIVAAVGGGNWTTGATWVGGVAPTAADDAQLTAASGNVTINSGAVARSLDCTTYVGTLTHSAAVTLTLGDATAGASNVALKLVAGMTYTLGSASTSAISFISTSATQQTVTSGGKALGNTTISGAGSSYLLGDAYTAGAGATFTLAAGTFNTGNLAVVLGSFVSNGAGAKTLTLGSSAITVAGNAVTSWSTLTGAAPTVTANTAVLTLTGANAGVTMNSTSLNGGSLVFTNAVTTAARAVSTTVVNCTYNGPAAIGATFQHTGLTVTGTLTITGDSVVNRVMVIANTFATQATLTAAAVSFTNVDFQDTNAAGASAPWTGTSMGDALGNANVTFDAAVTQTRTGAGGNWSTVGNWTSRAPLPQDDVVVGAGASGTITRDVSRLGKSIDFTGFAGTFATGAVAVASFGGLTFAAGMTLTGTLTWTLFGRGSHTITSNGKTFTQPVTISAPGGTYTLADAFVTTGSGGFQVTDGTFTTADFPVTAASLAAVSGRATTLNLGASVVTVTVTSGTPVNTNNAATVLNSSTATFVIGVASASTRTLTWGTSRTVGTITYTVAGSTGTLVLVAATGLTIGTLNFSDASNARTLNFTAGITYTISTAWNVNGTTGKLMTVDSATAATHTLAKASGTVSSDYLSVKNSLAGGGAAWYAGANSTDAGGNTGWIFTAPPATSSAKFLAMF